jgi:hypothetical protein
LEIKLVGRHGVPPSEIGAHRRIEEEFNGTPFTKKWRGYAAFGLQRQGRGGGTADYDLVLLTHTNVIVVELKNWNGRTLKSDGQKWYFNGEDRGTSPVIVANDKSRKLASALKSRLGDAKVPFVGFLVVLQGNIERTELPRDEERSVITLTELLSLRFESEYRLRFWKRGANPLDYINDYDAFFLGNATRPRDYLIEGFRPDANPIFEHPKGLYAEYRGVAKDDPQARALIRQWDFAKAGAQFAGEADRASVALREQRIYTYISERSDDLTLSLLRPLSQKAQSDVTTDFCEVFSLPTRISRLAEFANATLPKLSATDRLALCKVLLSKCADLHDLLIAHRDLSVHSIWLDVPPRIVLSGLSVAHYPQMKTVGTSRERVKVDPVIVSASEAGESEPTPYQRDAFMLGVVAHILLYGERPPAVSGRHFWQKRADDPFDGKLDAWFAKALAERPSDRFATARRMLDSLNDVTATKSEVVIDPADLEAFRAETKERDYPETRVIADDDRFLCFQSDRDGARLVVKVWYGAEADMQEPAGTLAALSFLERARAFKSSGLAGVPRIVDFGLSRGSLLLVQEWVEGLPIAEWLERKPDQEQRVGMAQSLLDTLERLHDLDLVHGDVHPGNIICSSKQVILIDGLDYRRGGADAYTTAYLPAHYKTMSLADRDRYGALAVAAEILGAKRDELPRGIFPLPEVYEALSDSLNSDGAMSTGPVRASLGKLAAGVSAQAFEGVITLRNLGYGGFSAGPLLADNGRYHVAVGPSKQSSGSQFLRVSGIGFEIRIDWDIAKDQLTRVAIVRIPQSQFLRNQNYADAHVPMRLSVQQGTTNDVDALVHFLLTVPEIQARVRAATTGTGASGPDDAEETIALSLPAQGKIAAIWSALLEAEEETFPLVVVAEDPRPNRGKEGQVLIPCHLDSGVLDFEPRERVVVENQDQNGEWRHFGFLDFRESTVGELVELAVDNPSGRANIRIGSKLRLLAAGSKGSLTKRKAAVERILADKANVPNLSSYFDPALSGQIDPIAFSGPSAQDLTDYSGGVFRLNQNQQQAFARVISSGPISLLQGPPGTGKTTFIAALLHYLITRNRARRILLVSQTHEAVNNALEKAFDAFHQTGTALDAVRLGAQSVVSNSIRSLSADSVEQYYRETFKSEQQKRLVDLGVGLGLPHDFCREFVALQLQLRSISDRITRWRVSLSEEGSDADSEQGETLSPRLAALEETFFHIATSVYEHPGGGEPEAVLEKIEEVLVARHGVLSRDAVERLRTLVTIANEWVSVLGAPDGNFVEFLAHARTVVAGTCVGIAQRGAFVTQNVYDWVIIDEAGRAAPSELAVAMQTGRRVLLVGDHKQLPPTFAEEVKSAMLDRFGGADGEMFNSDFARIFDSEYGRRVGTTLTTQYRMAGAIGRLVSECFYDGLLETARGAPPDYYEFMPSELSKEVTWVDISPYRERAYEQRALNDDGFANELEAKVVMGVLKRILDSEDFVAFLADHLDTSERGHEVPIGIICFYSRQRDLIDRSLAEATWLGERRRWVKVDTVDAYQGKENRIIILSTVRNNARGVVGFLHAPNRVNVAMSRAMERLVIVGSKSMWSARNSNLPLGKVFGKIESFCAQGLASIVSAEEFLR